MATMTHTPTRSPEPDAGPTVGKRPEKLSARLVRLVTGNVLQVILIIIAISWTIPSLGLLVSSLRPAAANAQSGWWTAFLTPAEFTLNNYVSLFQGSSPIIGAFWNTVMITVPTTILVVLIASLAGYAFATMQFRWRDELFLVVVAMLVVPLQVGLIPVARLFGAIGLFGTIPGVVLFHVAFGLPFAVFLLRNFFAGIPKELLEAARLDGANEFTIFWKVVLPIGLPAVASLSIFQFLWVWNDLLIGLVFAGENKPLTVAIQEQTRQFGSNIDVIAPGTFLTMIVPLIVFFSFQRYFVQGILAGSTKG